ncbi:hypothetical protein PAPYR_5148 [Paratrimastix pyriformis]|uniref:Uncharacterized protein n=1 Tax=Paratrimastix pyriformis TaxID=342808 RepID=A0ABQ8UIM6_9EUKA|nr:hypothetical protein PAPYR_5148 [Paratrimastix pyriformis]
MPNVIYQNIRELSHQYFIITVSEDGKLLRFQATQPGTSDFYEFSLNDDQLRTVLKDELGFLAPERRKEMVEFLVERLFLIREDGEWHLRIRGCTEVVAQIELPERVSLHRLSFAERMRIQEHNHLMTERRDRALEERQRQLQQKEREERDRQQKLRDLGQAQRAARITAERQSRQQAKLQLRADQCAREEKYQANERVRQGHLEQREQERARRGREEARRLHAEKEATQAQAQQRRQAEIEGRTRAKAEAVQARMAQKSQQGALEARRQASLAELQRRNLEAARQYASAQRSVVAARKAAAEQKAAQKREALRQQIEAEGAAHRARLEAAMRLEGLDEAREARETQRDLARRYNIHARAMALREAAAKKQADLTARIQAEKDRTFALARAQHQVCCHSPALSATTDPIPAVWSPVSPGISRLLWGPLLGQARLEREAAQKHLDDLRAAKIKERMAQRSVRERQYGESIRQSMAQELADQRRRKVGHLLPPLPLSPASFAPILIGFLSPCSIRSALCYHGRCCLVLVVLVVAGGAGGRDLQEAAEAEERQRYQQKAAMLEEARQRKLDQENHLVELRKSEAQKKSRIVAQRAERLVQVQQHKAAERVARESKQRQWEELEAKRALAMAARERARVARFIPNVSTSNPEATSAIPSHS